MVTRTSRPYDSYMTFQDNGVDVLELDGVELMKGRGGARCMTFPMRRSLSLEV